MPNTLTTPDRGKIPSEVKGGCGMNLIRRSVLGYPLQLDTRDNVAVVCVYRVAQETCYRVVVQDVSISVYRGHPLFGILHDVREVDQDLWPILVDMLLDYPETADAMRAILLAAQE